MRAVQVGQVYFDRINDRHLAVTHVLGGSAIVRVFQNLEEFNRECWRLAYLTDTNESIYGWLGMNMARRWIRLYEFNFDTYELV